MHKMPKPASVGSGPRSRSSRVRLLQQLVDRLADCGRVSGSLDLLAVDEHRRGALDANASAELHVAVDGGRIGLVVERLLEDVDLQPHLTRELLEVGSIERVLV